LTRIISQADFMSNDNKIEIEAVQFLRPNGEQRPVRGRVDASAKDGYEAMRRAGCRLTMEELSNGLVSITIEEPEVGDFDIMVVPNGPQVTVAVVAMLKRFDTVRFTHWKLETEQGGPVAEQTT
jgi:hypothetical protein